MHWSDNSESDRAAGFEALCPSAAQSPETCCGRVTINSTCNKTLDGEDHVTARADDMSKASCRGKACEA